MAARTRRPARLDPTVRACLEELQAVARAEAGGARWVSVPPPNVATMTTERAVEHLTARTPEEASDPARLEAITTELRRLDQLVNELQARRSAIYYTILGRTR